LISCNEKRGDSSRFLNPVPLIGFNIAQNRFGVKILVLLRPISHYLLE
jgi:hypothetical protein